MILMLLKLLLAETRYPQKQRNILKLRETISECTLKRRSDMENTLPDVTCVCKNHNLISVYCQVKVADEILKHQAFIIPDGTSRQGVGDLAGAVVKVSSHIRSLKCLQIVIVKTGPRPYTTCLIILQQHQTEM